MTRSGPIQQSEAVLHLRGARVFLGSIEKWGNSGLLVALVLGLFLSSAVVGQSLPFDHWLNTYWGLAMAMPDSNLAEHLIWPPDRCTVAAALSNPTRIGLGWLPDWVRERMADELRREMRFLKDTSRSEQWDWWRVGLVGWSGYRPVADYVKPSFWTVSEGTVYLNSSLLMYARVRASHDPRAVPSYTGIPRKKRRMGFNTAETDYAYAQYEGPWVLVRFGRLKESWGPGDVRSVWLSSWGPSYEGLKVALKYHGFRFHFFSGYLETIADSTHTRDIHRYLAGHFLLFSNGSNFVVGAGEITLYGGPFRSLSLTYLNPFTLQLEHEFNYWTNVARRYHNRDNWSLALAGEWYPKRRLRFWGIWVIDDIQIDREKKPNATALKAGASWVLLRPLPGVARLDYVRVGTWTYRHQALYLNYVSRGLPIGYDGGSDLQELRVSWRGFPARYVTADVWLGYREIGELNIKRDPNQLRDFPYGWRFPSGVVQRSWEGGVIVRYQPRYNIWIEAGLHWQDVQNDGHVAGASRNAFSGFVSLAGSFDFSFYAPRSVSHR